MYVHFLHLLLLLITVKCASSECRNLFMTICDTFKDLKDHTESDDWTELIIGSEKSTPNETLNLIDALPLHNYPKLTSVYVIKRIQNLEIRALQLCFFYNTKRLNTFAFYGNEFPTIKDYHFPVLGHVGKISLVNNKIETIQAFSFSRQEAEVFDVSNNLLDVIEGHSLPTTAKLKTVIAKNNKLTHIEPNSFSNGVESLHLDHNKLRQLTVVENLTQLKELTLSHNKFSEIPNISQLKNLTVFDFSFNSVTSLNKDLFTELNNLKLLDLSHNQIVAYRPFTFLVGPNKQNTLTISLGFNRMPGLDPVDEIPFRKETLFLFGNPWNCPTIDEIMKTLFQRMDQCDRKFFASGIMPYCFNYAYPGRNSHYNWQSDKEKFWRIIEENRGKMDCSLTLRKNGVIDPVVFSCGGINSA